MNEDIEPILIGDVDDLEIGSVENFEHEEKSGSCKMYCYRLKVYL